MVRMKLFLKKAWVWLKHYWYIPALLIYTIVLWVFFRRSNNRLLEVLDITKESYEKEIQVMKSAHEKEIQKREEIVLLYQETLKNIENEFNIKTKELSSKKQKEIKKIVEENREDPSVLAEEMKKLFGV
tara:strand:- start:367 stop:753 length:387 start_codon:yes stop_codon:yes gene_type:complete